MPEWSTVEVRSSDGRILVRKFELTSSVIYESWKLTQPEAVTIVTTCELGAAKEWLRDPIIQTLLGQPSARFASVWRTSGSFILIGEKKPNQQE
jgi:hypothetical protein